MDEVCESESNFGPLPFFPPDAPASLSLSLFSLSLFSLSPVMMMPTP